MTPAAEPSPADLFRALAAALRALGEDRGRDPAGGPLAPRRLDRRDPALIETTLPALRWLERHYFRLCVDGLEHLESAGAPALLVGNHNGGMLGPDVLALLGTLWDRLGPEAPVYGLAHDFAMRSVPLLGRLAQRFGAVRAAPDVALAALRVGARVLVYPGGDREAYRAFWRRDRVELGGRTGFVRIAQAAGAPIVPVVVAGAHRSAVILHEGHALARWTGVRRRLRSRCFPIALALPWGVSVGPWLPYLPLPFRLRFRILPPVDVPPTADPAAVARDLQTRMQRTLDELSAG